MINIGKVQRKAHQAYLRKNKLIAKIIAKYLRIVYSCDISYKADIDASVVFSHTGLGTVIGSDVVIGSNTKILQHVTVGGRGDHRAADGRAVPIIGKNVLIGAGACVAGPITIGDNAQIGANAVVLCDIPENATAVGIPARVISGGHDEKDKTIH